MKLKDGREFQAKIVGTRREDGCRRDQDRCGAICRSCSSATATQVRVGQFAFAIGAPFKLDYTFTYGVISGKGRSKLLETGGYNISDYLQTDASINPGQQRRPALRHRRQSGRHEHAHQRLQSRPRFRHSEQSRERNRQQLIAGHKIIRPWLGIRIETLGDDPSIRDLFKGRR